MSELPELSHLQAAIIDAMGAREITGRELRKKLKEARGINKSGPAFYQVMSRLAESKFVDTWTKDKNVEGHSIKETYYQLRAEGEIALRASYDWYQNPPEFIGIRGGQVL